jgi:hypothetical protein
MRTFPFAPELCPEVHAGDGTIEGAIKAVRLASSFGADEESINEILVSRGFDCNTGSARLIKIAANLLS